MSCAPPPTDTLPSPELRGDPSPHPGLEARERRTLRTLAAILGALIAGTWVVAHVTEIVPLQGYWAQLPTNPFFTSALAGAVLLLLAAAPGRLRLLVALGVGLGLLGLSIGVLRPTGVPGWTLAVKGSAGLAALVVLVATAVRAGDPDLRRRAADAAVSAVLLPGFVLVSFFFLGLTIALFPTTQDAVVYAVDGTFGRQLGFDVGRLAGGSPWVVGGLSLIYVELPLVVTGLIVLGGRRPDLPFASLMKAFLAMAVVGYAGYVLFPVAGPIYTFGGAWPGDPPDPATLRGPPLLVMPVPRNCMPSLHTAWALLLAWSTRGHARWVQGIGLVWLVGTVLATLGLGYHYLVDLVAACPLALAVYVAVQPRFASVASLRRQALALGAGLGLAWLLLARYGLPVLGLHPFIPWTLALSTLGVTEWQRHRFQSVLLAAAAVEAPEPAAPPAPRPGAGRAEDRPVVLAFALAFVLSGAAGLVYEVVFTKKLALIFGSTTVAMTLVLATFMGGMALGSLLGGRVAARLSDPLRAYAACEAGIGLWCLATPLWVLIVESLYLALAPPLLEEPAARGLLQLAIGALFLLPPTVLMGATLPLLAEILTRRQHSLGHATGLLYGANTAGAALGALGSGYLLLPHLGVSRSVWIAIALNLGAALVALRLRERLARARAIPPPTGPPAPAPDTPATAAVSAPRSGMHDRRLGWVAFLALGVGGVASFVLETTYVQLLSLVAASSTYAFALMLATFLTGLALGAWIARRFVLPRSQGDWVFFLGAAWIGVAAVLLLGNLMWHDVPDYLSRFAPYPATRTFAARETVRFLICTVAMMPPAIGIGLAYPLALEAIGTAWPDHPTAMLGRGAALNTLGNISGALLGSFVLLPRIGSLATTQLVAGVCLALGIGFVAFVARRGQIALALAAAVTVALLAAQPARFDLDRMASGAQLYFEPQAYGRVIDHHESPETGLVTVTETRRGDRRVRTLLSNGMFEGDDDPLGEIRAQYGIALFPLRHQPRRDAALLVGLGTGTSAGVLACAGFEHLTVAELSPAVLRFARRYFSRVHAGVLDRPNVRVRVTDGRNLLYLRPDRYDLISLELSSIWLPGQAAFYNQEFYRLARRRLRPGGVLQQWLQVHRLRRDDLRSIVATLRSVFPEVYLYFSAPDTLAGGQGVLVACTGPCAPTAATHARIDAAPELAPALRRMGGTAAHLGQYLLLDPPGVQRLLDRAGRPIDSLVSTDDNLLLEFSTPKANVRPYLRSLHQNLLFLASHAVR